MDEEIEQLAHDLFREAQNNQMIDQNYTEAGKLMIAAADALLLIGAREERLIETLLQMIDQATKTLKDE